MIAPRLLSLMHNQRYAALFTLEISMSVATAVTKAFKIIKLVIDNFRGVECMEVDAAGKHIIINGPNGSGKTSAADALVWALSGKHKGSSVVRHGTDEASCYIELNNGVEGEEIQVYRSATPEGKTKFTLARGGEYIHEGKQGVINLLLSKYMLDPMSFLSLRQIDQKDTLLQLCNAPPPEQAVQSITGISFPANAGESAYSYLMRLAGDKTGIYYLDRAEANAAYQTLSKSLTNAKEVLQAMPEVAEPTPMDCLMKRLEAFQEIERINERAVADSENLGEKADALAKELITLERDITAMEHDITRVEADLVKRKEAVRASKAYLEERNVKYREVGAAYAAAYDNANGAINRTTDIAAVKAEIAAANDAHARFNRRKDARDRVAKLKAEVNEASAHAANIEHQLDKLRQLRTNVLKSIDIGIAGLEISDDAITVDGIQLPQLCMSHQLRVAVAVAAAQNPGLAVVRLDEGERLDHRSRMALINICDERDCQLVLTCVEDQDQRSVILVDA